MKRFCVRQTRQVEGAIVHCCAFIRGKTLLRPEVPLRRSLTNPSYLFSYLCPNQGTCYFPS